MLSPSYSPFRTPQSSPPFKKRLFLSSAGQTPFRYSPRRSPVSPSILPTARATRLVQSAPALRGFARVGGRWGRYGIDGETKYKDLDLTTNAIPANPFGFGSLNVVPLGDGPDARIGRKITVTSVQMRYTCDIHRTETNVVYFRIIIGLDKQANGAAPLATDIFVNPSVLAQRNLDNSSRFTILYDKVHRFNPSVVQGTDTRYNGPNLIKVYKKCNIPITYDNTATTGALTTIRSNNLFLMGFQYGNNTALNDFKCNFRLRYRDD